MIKPEKRLTQLPPMWVIYGHHEEPAHFVVKCWHSPTAASQPVVAPTLEAARALLPAGLANLGRQPSDDPTIVEVWI